MALQLYHMKSSRSARILWLLEELGLDYELTVVERHELKTESYLQKNPVGKVPVFFDGDKRITESVAALQYLSDVHGNGRFTRKAGDEDYHEYLQLMEFGEAGMGGYVGMLVGQTVLLPEEHRIEAMKLWSHAETKKCLAFLEQTIPSEGYLLGEFSLADISITYILFLLKITKNAGDFGEKTNQYFKRVTARKAWQKASSV